MKSPNNKSTTILLMILIAAAAVLYRSMFAAPSVEFLLQEDVALNTKVEDALEKIEAINFDMAVFNDPKFQTFKSIETPLPSIPKGRDNPFASIFGK